MKLIPGNVYKITFRSETARISLKKNRQFRQEFISNDYAEVNSQKEYVLRNCYSDFMYIYIVEVVTEGSEGSLLTPVVNFIYNGKNCMCWEDMGILSDKNSCELMG